MRTENGILIFKDQEEQEKTVFGGSYRGIFLRKSMNLIGRYDVVGIRKNKKVVIDVVSIGFVIMGMRNSNLKEQIIEIIHKSGNNYGKNPTIALSVQMKYLL